MKQPLNPELAQKKAEIEKSLYTTVKETYSKSKPISRIIYIVEIIQPELATMQKRKEKLDKEKEKELEKEREKVKAEIIPNFISDLKRKINNELDNSGKKANLMLLFIGTAYALVGLEDSTNNLMKMVKLLRGESKIYKNCHIIYFNEECPTSMFPTFYKYEGEFIKGSQTYKDMLSAEKGWNLYDNFFCKLGKRLQNIIKTESEFEAKTKEIAEEQVNFLKYLPSADEAHVFLSDEFLSAENFCNLYLDELELEFDDDLVYPYYWPINI